MFVFGQLTLQQLDCILREGRQNRERSRQSSLAKSAVTDSTHCRIAVNTVSDSAADAAASVGFRHGGLQGRGEMVLRVEGPGNDDGSGLL